MGGPRYVALALLALVFGVPGVAAATAAAPSPSLPGRHLTYSVHQTAARGDVVLRQDTSSSGSAARSGSTPSTRFTRKLDAPTRVRLLAARLYWGARPPSHPSTRRVSSDLKKTAEYYAHVSRGRQHLHSTLTRWVHVDASADVMCNTEHASIHAASVALRQAGYHPGRFNRLMIFTEQCNSAASAAQLPGRVSWIRYRSPGMATLVHELGHNMGLEHAYGLVCRQDGRRVALGNGCLPVEYGDSWDAMGHSKGFFSAAALVRLGWAGHIQRVRHTGTYAVADVEHSGDSNQALRIRAGGTTYWVEYQPEHSPQVGRTIPGVMIRRQVGGGPVEIIDASPGNPTGIAFPDRDLTNSALPVGSSLTTPEDIRITTVATGRKATVQVTFDERAAVPDAPQVDAASQLGTGAYRVHWRAPADNGQIVLGYRVTSLPSGVTTFVRSPGGYRTSVRLAPDKLGSGVPSFTVRALNQIGWSPASTPVTAAAYGPTVTVTSPSSGDRVHRHFAVTLDAAADPRTHAAPTIAWAEVGSSACTSQSGPGPYTLLCDGTGRGAETLTVHVTNAYGVTTEVPVPVTVRGS